MKITKNNLKNKKAGFTLIELMVSISIFMGIMLMAMGSLFISLNAVNKVRAQQIAVDNVNFAMESMARSIRTGTKYLCENQLDHSQMEDPELVLDCPNGLSQLAFVPQNSLTRIAYKLAVGGIVQRCNENLDCTNITSPNVNIEKLDFFVKGNTLGDEIHPSVYIIMKGTVNVKGEPTSFAIQTMASQRNLE